MIRYNHASMQTISTVVSTESAAMGTLANASSRGTAGIWVPLVHSGHVTATKRISANSVTASNGSRSESESRSIVQSRSDVRKRRAHCRPVCTVPTSATVDDAVAVWKLRKHKNSDARGGIPSSVVIAAVADYGIDLTRFVACHVELSLVLRNGAKWDGLLEERMRINWPTDCRRPVVVAHRGMSAHCPENTHAAFEAALKAGADGIEFDVQLTADNRLVIVHDQSLERFGHAGMCVSKSQLKQIQELDMGSWHSSEFSGQRIPLLDDVLTDYGTLLTLCIELKPYDLSSERRTEFLKAFVKSVEAHQLESTICVLCFDVSLLQELYSYAPWARLVWNTHHPENVVESDFRSRSWLSGFDGRIDRITTDTVSLAHRFKLTTLSFTCNTVEEITKAEKCGIDVLIGNDPVQMRQVLEMNSVCEHET